MPMKRFLWLVLAALVMVACASATESQPKNSITIIDGTNITSLTTSELTPLAILGQANITLAPEDRILSNGLAVKLDAPLGNDSYTLQIRRAVPVTLLYNNQEQTINTSAFTVGEALTEAGLQLYTSDYFDPPLATPIQTPITVNYQPAKIYSVSMGNGTFSIHSSSDTVGQALATGGIPLVGLDYSIPGEADPVPADGQIKIVRVSESVSLLQKSIPYKTEFQLTAELELDQQDMLQMGAPGLAVSRIRSRYENGQEVSRETEAEAIVRPPQDGIIGAGTKIVVRTLETPDGPIQYYRSLQVYATSYSPCRAGPGRCGHGTAGGMKVTRGVIAVRGSWWRYMNGDPVYIPGYGRAVISDIGGGIPGRYWIDLGFTDEDYESWHNWTTLYWLAPPPATIMWVLPY
jgi:uncharacterized protein YabE (DUF348 family)